MNIGETELPILIRLINSLQEPLSLFFLRKMKEDFDRARAVMKQVAFQVDDGAISVFPEGVGVKQLFRKPLTAENLRMHPDDQHFLIIGTIKDADASAFGKAARRTPQKVVFQFLRAGLFETEDFAPLWVNS